MSVSTYLHFASCGSKSLCLAHASHFALARISQIPGRGDVTLPTVAIGSDELQPATNQLVKVTLLVQAGKPSVSQ